MIQKLIFSYLVVFWIYPSVLAFNIDLDSPLLLRPPTQRGVHFGFSLAHIINGTERTLLVGAPKAQTIQDVESPGALYSCPIDGSDPNCHQLNVDSRMSDDKYRSWITEDLKGDQRLGYSLAARDDSIVVCAPRWHIFDSRTTGTEDLPLGICFAANSPDFKFQAFSPPYLYETGGKKSFQNIGSCQIGISLAYVKERNSISVGSPGCWTWQGDTWEVGLDSLEDPNSYRTLNQLEVEDVDLTLNTAATGFDTIADLYLGYSVTSLKYADMSAIASAMPRTVSTSELRVYEKNLVLGPMIYILKDDISNPKKLNILDTIKPPKNKTQQMEASMESMFSYFGYSLTSADVNGDDLDDIIVGAPFYHNSTHQDQGAIFVYTQNKFPSGSEGQWGFEMKEEPNAPLRMGSESYGRFGSCVAAIGDIDSDGFQDIAVGAPFLKEGGAVFIYMGSSTGLERDVAQVIKASEMPAIDQPVKGFGFSIAQNLRGQSNRGNELAVGAYSSDLVVVFKAKEVISLHWNLTIDNQIDLTQDNCIYTSEKLEAYPCVKAEVCLVYRKMKSSVFTKQTLAFRVSLKADIEHSPKRLFFDNGKAENQLPMQLMEDQQKCETLNIMANKDVIHDVKPFAIRGEVNFLKQDDDKVVLDPRTDLIKDKELDILVPCEGAEAESCQSDLRLTVKVLTTYSLDSQERINVNFLVKNLGEPAYNTRLIISSGGDLLVQGPDEDVSCEMRGEDAVCFFDVIFPKDSQSNFVLTMTATQKFFQNLKTHEDRFHVNATLTTSSNITSPWEATKYFHIPIKVNGNLDLTKDPSNPPIVLYNSSSYYKTPHEAQTEEELGPEILHTYKIFNRNSYNIYRTQITIRWPLKVEGKYFLYLLGMPEFSGAKPVCNYTNGKVDEYKLQKPREFSVHGDFKPAPAIGQVRDSRLAKIKAIKLEYLEFQCIIGELASNNEIFIRLRSRLVQMTIKELEMGSDLGDATSYAQIQALEIPLGAPRPDPSPVSSVTTIISYSNEAPTYVLPWWVYLVSVLGGLLLLTVIILVLWKCGFFKRKRAEKVDGADQPDGGEADGKGDKGADEEEEDEDSVPSPETPMLNDTEKVDGELEFSEPRPLEP